MSPMLTKLLTALGLRSRCCGAPIETWHAGRDICSHCQQWLRKDKSAEAIDKLADNNQTGKLKLKHIKTR